MSVSARSSAGGDAQGHAATCCHHGRPSNAAARFILHLPLPAFSACPRGSTIPSIHDISMDWRGKRSRVTNSLPLTQGASLFRGRRRCPVGPSPREERSSPPTLAFEVAGERCPCRHAGFVVGGCGGAGRVGPAPRRNSSYAARGQMLPPYDTRAAADADRGASPTSSR